MHLLSLAFSPKNAQSDQTEQKGKIVLLTDMPARSKIELEVVYKVKEDAATLSASTK
jgi:hypothetical protein